jgi:hypothetical protein
VTDESEYLTNKVKPTKPSSYINRLIKAQTEANSLKEFKEEPSLSIKVSKKILKKQDQVSSYLK